MSTRVRFLHISDLHFWETDDQKAARFCHDVSCLARIEELLQQESPDFLIVSGDLTNIGDQLSIDRVYQWIHSHIVVAGVEYGLRCNERGIGVLVVPGNHDAYGAKRHGATLGRLQQSLENYFRTFHAYVPSDRSGVHYQWISKGSTDIFVCCIDSCYLGDNDSSNEFAPFVLDKIAKGRISKAQSKKILEIYDRGMNGSLEDAAGERIERGRFLASLKLAVVHHYLFKPADSKFEPLMEVDQIRAVFQNFAMADFDAMMCGHKHVADTRPIVYLDEFDPRGRARLALNHVRRTLGIGSRPVRYDDDGRPESKFFRFILSVLYYSRKAPALTEKVSDEIIHVLQESMSDPEVLKSFLLKATSQKKQLGAAHLFEDDEIETLYRNIRQAFGKAEMMKLRGAAEKLQGLVAKLAGRPFVQFSCGSSAKATETEGRSRAVCIYDVLNDDAAQAYVLRSTRYSWAVGSGSNLSGAKRFVSAPPIEYRFPLARV